MGDGLKAEMFVKPFGGEPPYFKPGKGGKVAYGTVNELKHQASARAHRIGQTRPVTFYSLAPKNTIEEKILQLHANKRDMADTLLEGSDQNSRLNTKELLELLREG